MKRGSRRPQSGLRRYRELRDFRSTPEPAPRGRKKAEQGSFVVHRHEARRLHYDLRLNAGDALVCFAIPRGFTYDATVRHLAVHTEDHPLEYETFRGVIPKGQYGAGTMSIFDRGTFEVLRATDLRSAVRAGKVEIRLHGLCLRGEWHLVETNAAKNEWLLLKSRDGLESDRPEAAFELDLSSAVEEPAPRSFRAMRPARNARPFSASQWCFELDLDGRRCLLVKDGATVRWFDSSLEPLHGGFDRLTREVQSVRACEAWIDGVLVAHDATQRPDRKVLDRKLRAGDDSDLTLYAFDLPRLEGSSLCAVPLRERKQLLRSLLRESKAILFVDAVPHDGEALCSKVREWGLPGVIAKRVDGVYQQGKSEQWLRIPSPRSTKRSSRRNVAEIASASLASRAPLVRLTHRAKVYFPDCGITKGEVFDYYAQMGETLLPYLRERPLHLHRYPDGIAGESFYQKHLPAGAPSWIRSRLWKDEQGRELVVCDDLRTLLYLVNLGSIDFHPWMSRIDAPDSPDFVVLDLDPKQAPFADVVRVARTLGKLLRGIGLKPLLKTSGSTGLHLYVSLRRGCDYEQGRMFCEAVARCAVQEHPEIATVERSIAARGRRVYVDFGQNRRGQTIAAPYVVRPVAGARVSTPLSWDELETTLDPASFDVRTVPERLRRIGDLFAPLLHDAADLAIAVSRLEEMLQARSRVSGRRTRGSTRPSRRPSG